MKYLVLLMSFLTLVSCLRKKEYDLVVYSATPAAITAAVQAKQDGLSVVIVEPSNHVGGLTTGGLGWTD
jgi:ribulose 1,5-bisphosphate synthetase/thiazole synthase